MKTLRIATFLAPNVYPVYRFMAEYIGQKLNYPTEIIYAKSHDEYFDIAADMSFICGLPYILFKEQNPDAFELLAAPVLLGERYQDKPIYFSDVIVAQDSPYQSFEDLRGKKWGYNEKVSQSGYGITRQHLLKLGETNGFFGRVINAMSHQNSIRLIADGKLDGGAIDTQVLEVELMQHPELKEQIRIIDTFGPSPIQPVVADKNMTDSLKADIQTILLAIGQDESTKAELAKGIFKCFVRVVDSDYDPIREMLAQAKQANFLTLK